MNKQKIKRILASFWPKDLAERSVVIYYHSVNPNHPLGMHPTLFREHMNWLKSNCQIIRLSEIKTSKAMKANGKPTVSITFDDGYEDNYEFAFPILEELEIPATIFFAPKYAGLVPPDIANVYRGLRFFGWEQAREMAKPVISIQSHSFSHCNLGEVPLRQAEEELRVSKTLIEEKLYQEVFAFAYPWGQKGYISESVSEVAIRLGYRMGFTTIWGKVTDRNNSMLLPRIEISSTDTLEVLKAKISGKYDFLKFAHKIRKPLIGRTRL
ncbi:MAG: polysaccharide deacetylase family protein [Candidatus Methanofastidiosa archaeon]|nr:polysaccharide deacetylase family protein [Candidatus Methanofastidiosa archaeon]